jgi:hypothetical protein
VYNKMNHILFALLGTIHATYGGIITEITRTYELSVKYEAIPKNVRINRHLTESSGAFGLCLYNVVIPEDASLVCDPPNRLPQICTLKCADGYYSVGNKDVACADSICSGSCSTESYEIVGADIQYSSRPCEYTRYVECNTTASGLCLETVLEECKYSYYVETRRPSCRLKQENVPEDCWTSGCFGNCDKPGNYHYYSLRCSDSCIPWRDPAEPEFACKKCSEPLQLNGTILEYITPSQIRYICPKGTWGEPSGLSYCMSFDGSWYPPAPSGQVQCSQCIIPEIFYDITDAHILNIIDNGEIEIRCTDGYLGEDAIRVKCSQLSGTWNYTVDDIPQCYIWSPTATPTQTPSITSSASITPIDPSTEPTTTPTHTPSASKSPRAPKVKGSRAPSPAPKVRGSMIPAVRTA